MRPAVRTCSGNERRVIAEPRAPVPEVNCLAAERARLLCASAWVLRLQPSAVSHQRSLCDLVGLSPGLHSDGPNLECDIARACYESDGCVVRCVAEREVRPPQ